MIRSRDVVFTENLMYKDQFQGNKEEKENTEYTMLDEIKENKVPKVSKNQEQQQVPQTLSNVRLYTRLRDPLNDSLLHCIIY